MEYDFFDEENGEKTPEKQTQRNPAPSVWSGKTPDGRKERGKKVRWWHVVTALSIAVIAFFGGYMTSWLSLDGEVRTLLAVKKEIQENYYKEVTDGDFYKAVFGGINENLLDAYSHYMTPEEFAEAVSDLEGNRQGIGLVFHGQGEKPLRIVRVCGNSPAEKAGIIAGEEIISCGKEEESTVACATFEELAAFLDALANGEEFFLGVRSPLGDRRVKLSKQAYVENYVFYRTSTASYAFTGDNATELESRGAPLSYLDGDTAYIRLVQFTGNATAEFAGAMAKFKEEGKKHLILDLRANGGGYLDVMQSIASYFCRNTTEEKPVVAVADYGESQAVYRATGNLYNEYFQADSRVYVLADSGTASASECLIGCMIDYGAIEYKNICLAEREGVAKTYGKGIMQETRLVNIIKQDALKLTTAEIFWPKGSSIHDRGVLPQDGTLTIVENFDYEEETRQAIEKLLAQ